jgi:ATP-dependent Clp protease protease subunit
VSEQTATQELYLNFCGEINSYSANRLVNWLALATTETSPVSKVHLILQSYGGTVGDGIYLHNFLKAFPIDIYAYNIGHIASAATIAFLGAKFRLTARNATFMVHRTLNPLQYQTAENLRIITESLALDDQRTEEILRCYLKLPGDLWNQFQNHDVTFSGDDAVKFDLAHSIGEPSLSIGTKVRNVL